ncbi:major facilitator superfamily transporter [Sodiomyces alkalinus F11]|uniref:Major facilitator superfamily transporter n=1 Tax=Sodiomyces alkalinus (strain CBS 110278 / VKM F-3762 / F11) TaxID=1314773 RepID=A0A3N2Q780_SODAK|nr:major facilitator superfamily transporter [Sodiomyces alkalinus F11]ROT42643.1 major facilitator superfamily transporter [Sodiomyces alkalinus F11]
MTATERTPLLGSPPPGDGSSPLKPRCLLSSHAESKAWSSICSPANRILMAGFLVSLTLGLTQVPIIYVFRIMTCDAFYAGGSAKAASPPADRCARREIDAATASQVSFLGMTTSVCGIANLFICGALIRRLGPRWAFVSQTSLLAVRVACQIVAVAVGGKKGIILMQATQLVGVVGGPRGYMLVLNTAVAEVVERRRHTAVFGKLQGALMMGTAGGYLLGGILGDAGIQIPFVTAVGCFIVGTLYGTIFMPTPPASKEESANDSHRAPTGFLSPIKVFIPPRFRLESGRVVRHYGLVFLALGVFFGVFATGYAPILIQMYATSRFQFGTTENGILMSGNSLIRGVFLMFIFPKLIDVGRRWFASSAAGPTASRADLGGEPLRREEGEILPTNPDEWEPVPGLVNSEEPTKPPPEEDDEDSMFDLSFLRWSLLVDGIVTSISAWATEGWHMYLAAFLLPFASGSAPAAKGVITEMCPSYLRQDALSAITLVESAATLTTQGLFGLIYASLSTIGRANLTFFCNGGLAMVAVCILSLAHYPPANSTRVDDAKDDERDDGNP